MGETMSIAAETSASRIKFAVGIGLQGPIVPGAYEVENARIVVDYPDQVPVGLPSPLKLPRGVSTLFTVSWWDKKGQTKKCLESKSFERHLPIYFALDLINKLLMAFKLVRVGHADGMRIRTVGISDTLFYFSLIDEVPTGDLNIGMRLDKRDYPWLAGGDQWFDRSGTTELALPHINVDTFPVARRYVRCFELLEHGFYREAIIVSHAILDDLVTDVIHAQLENKGLDDEQARDLLVRAVKESRFRVYLGPLLKILVGNSIREIWSDADRAINWLNTVRNKVAHQGLSGDRDSACKAIFVSIKTAAALHSRGLVNAEFPPGMFREARVAAAWTVNPEPWVPSGDGIEFDPFDPTSEKAAKST
jgi:hypothetical protein